MTGPMLSGGRDDRTGIEIQTWREHAAGWMWKVTDWDAHIAIGNSERLYFTRRGATRAARRWLARYRGRSIIFREPA